MIRQPAPDARADGWIGVHRTHDAEIGMRIEQMQHGLAHQIQAVTVVLTPMQGERDQALGGGQKIQRYCG